MSEWYNINLKDIRCYSRYKQAMLKNLQEFYKAYLAGDLGGTQQSPLEILSCESTFCEEFESDWFSLNTYVLQFGETFDEPWFQLPPFNFVYEEEFEQQWFDNNNFINEYEDEFDTQWFIDNIYINQWDEDFEGEDWDV